MDGTNDSVASKGDSDSASQGSSDPMSSGKAAERAAGQSPQSPSGSSTAIARLPPHTQASGELDSAWRALALSREQMGLCIDSRAALLTGIVAASGMMWRVEMALRKSADMRGLCVFPRKAHLEYAGQVAPNCAADLLRVCSDQLGSVAACTAAAQEGSDGEGQAPRALALGRPGVPMGLLCRAT